MPRARRAANFEGVALGLDGVARGVAVNRREGVYATFVVRGVCESGVRESRDVLREGVALSNEVRLFDGDGD